jgi:hypothetical protein
MNEIVIEHVPVAELPQARRRPRGDRRTDAHRFNGLPWAAMTQADSLTRFAGPVRAQGPRCSHAQRPAKPPHCRHRAVCRAPMRANPSPRWARSALGPHTARPAVAQPRR